MLKHGEINPLNVFGLRELEHCPPHFARVPVSNMSSPGSIKMVKNWIYENLEGRFWIGSQIEVTDGRSPRQENCVAFEDNSEASYFALCLDRIFGSDQSLMFK